MHLTQSTHLSDGEFVTVIAFGETVHVLCESALSAILTWQEETRKAAVWDYSLAVPEIYKKSFPTGHSNLSRKL